VVLAQKHEDVLSSLGSLTILLILLLMEGYLVAAFVEV
jgi:hypothetical protein